MKRTKHYFTLIEILTVAAIIAILAGISVGAIALINNKNAEAKTQATIKALEMALARFKAENGYIFIPAGYNITKPAPAKLILPQTIPSNLNGSLYKYLDQQLINSATKKDGTNIYFVDAWDRPLIFRFPGKFNTSGFDLGSVGPNGKIGEDGTEIKEDTDLSSLSDYDTKFGQGDDITNFLRKD